MVAPVNFPVPDFDHPEEKEHRRQIAQATRNLMAGKTNAAQDFDLDATGSSSTTVQDTRVAATSRVILVPANNHAANDLASGTVEVPPAQITPGVSFVVTHVPSTLTRSFRASILS